MKLAAFFVVLNLCFGTLNLYVSITPSFSWPNLVIGILCLYTAWANLVSLSEK